MVSVGNCFTVSKRKKCADGETIVAEAIKNGDVYVAVSKLIKKPSVFARTWDKLLRNSNAEEYKFDMFSYNCLVISRAVN